MERLVEWDGQWNGTVSGMEQLVEWNSWWNGTGSGMEAMGLHERTILFSEMEQLMEWKRWICMSALFYWVEWNS